MAVTPMSSAEENVQFTRTLGECVLQAGHEDEFVQDLARTLREHVKSDVVIVRLLADDTLQTRAVADDRATKLLAADAVSVPFSGQDRHQWLALLPIAYVPDITASSLVKTAFRQHGQQLGITGKLIVPLVAEGKLLGQVVFGWADPPEVEQLDRDQLRRLVDVAALHLTFLELRMVRNRDPLTDLPNRAALEQRWPADGQGVPGGLLYMDLDSFKAFNDAHGHAGGDDYLRRVASLLVECASSEAEVYRFGGDEFIILAPDFEEADAEKLKQTIHEHFLQLEAHIPPPRPSITIGMAHCPADGTELNELLRVADERMFQIKRKRAQLGIDLVADSRRLELPDGVFPGWLQTWPDGVLVTDANYKVMYVNRMYEEMTGYSLEEWTGRTPGFVASGKTAPKTYRAMWHALGEVGSWTGQVINRHRDGTEWVSHLSITRITDPDGRIIGYLGNARDVSHSLWAGNPEVRTAFQEAFTQEALAFALAEAGQLHEGGSREHLERIRDFTRLLVQGAADRNYPDLQRFETRTAIILSSILHDIGKLAIPEGLLRKPGRLSPAEFELIKTHTTAGEELLQSPYLGRDVASPQSDFLSMAATIARSHHEWWDGSGYPDGLEGDAIPLAARIVGIADVYDALRSQRPYKHSWSHRDTVDYIAEGAGRQFDPDLVRIFLELADEFEAVSRRTKDESRIRSGSRKNGKSPS